MNTVAIIQARMGSSRLYGKVLRKVGGRELLEVMILRVMQSKLLDNVVIATTTHSRDDIIVEFCCARGVNVFRGPEENVLERYYQVAKKLKAVTVVRMTADCPLIDPEIIDLTIKAHLESGADYTGNQIKRTFPRGLDVEVMKFSALEDARNHATKDFEREHVTPFIYTHSERFKLKSFESEKDMGHHRWTVDTDEDFALIKCVFKHFQGRETEIRIDEIYDFVEANPDVFSLNSHIVQKGDFSNLTEKSIPSKEKYFKMKK